MGCFESRENISEQKTVISGDDMQHRLDLLKSVKAHDIHYNYSSHDNQDRYV